MASRPATGSEQVDQEAARAALADLPKADRDWVLKLPTSEAMATIRLLIAFPGSRFGEHPSDGY